MRHRPFLAKYTRSALSGQGNPGSGISCSRYVQQQRRRTSTDRPGSNAIHEQRSHHDVNALSNGTSHSQPSTKIPVHGRQRYHDADEDDEGRSCLLHIEPQPTSTVYTTAILSYLLKDFGSVLEFARLNRSKSESPISPAGKVYRATFTQPKILSKVLNATPLTLHVDANGIAHNPGSGDNDDDTVGSSPSTASTASPSSAVDPYDILGLKGRHLPSPCTFTCTFERAPASMTTPLEATTPGMRPALLSHQNSKIQQESLVNSGMSKSMAGVFALQPGEVPLEEEPADTGDGGKPAPKDLWFAR